MADGSIVIEVKGDAKELEKALKNVSKSAESLSHAVEGLSASFQAVENASSSIDGGNLDSAARSADNLDGSLDDAAQAASQLDDSLDQTDDGGLGEAEKAADRLDRELDEAADSADELDRELDDIGETSSRLGDIFKGTFLADLSMKGLEVAAQAAGALLGAVKDIATESLNQYSAFQQLTGGVETLFKTSADTVKGYADVAYKTAGMSANTYMETVTSFSASLIQGLGGDVAAAADVANMAIIDMSDNANKMGSSMQSLQDAYQGFAKQNYTMLDNLKLGYGGTQQEMIRLINDSGVLNEKISSLDGITFDTIIKAIHEIQTQLDITGTTAKEASTTIEGSINSAKAAWDNLLTGMANPDADLGRLMTEFADSITTAFDNILPQVIRIFQNIGPVISGVIPTIAQNITGLTEVAVAIIQGLADGIVAASPILAAQAPALIGALIQAAIAVAIAAVQVGWALAEAIVTGFHETIYALIDVVSDAVGKAVEFVKADFSAVAGAIVESLSQATQPVRDWATGIKNAFDELKSSVSQIVENLRNNVNLSWDNLKSSVSSTVEKLKSDITKAWDNIKSAISKSLDSIKSTVKSAWDNVKSTVSSVLDNIKSTVTNVWNNIKSTITNAVNNVKSSVSTAFENIKSTISSTLNAAKSTALSVFESIKSSITEKINAARDAVQRAIDKIKSIMNFSWSLPHLKLPHISISGGFSINPPSAPKFSISWYKKGGVMMDPTIFGMAGSTLLGGGEAGPEAIAPISVLQDYVSEAVTEAMAEFTSELKTAVEEETAAISAALGNRANPEGGSINNSYGGTTINIYVDGAKAETPQQARDLGRELGGELNREMRRRGLVPA